MADTTTGTLRIRYANKESVFEHARINRRQADELIRGHLINFGLETVTDETGVEVRRAVDPATVIAEWVENARTDREIITVLPIPVVPVPANRG